MRKTIVGGASTPFLMSLALIGVVPGPAESGEGDSSGAKYTFTTVLDSQRDGLTPTRCAAINTLGTVAVTVRDDAAGLTKIITKRGANDAPVVVADTRSVADFPTLCDNGFNNLPSDPSINEKGEVAFQGNLRRLTGRADCDTPEQRQRRQGVFLGRGGPLTTIAHTINPPGGDFISEFLVADQSVNTFGKVAFVPELDETFDQGSSWARGTGPSTAVPRRPPHAGRVRLQQPLVPRVAQRARPDRVRERPQRPARGRDLPLRARRHVPHDRGQHRRFASVGDPSLNLLGRVAFTADRFDENSTQIFSVNTSRGGAVTTVAESSPGGYASFREPSLNDLGAVVFTADVQPDPEVFVTFQGVFTGRDPVADKVLQAGDSTKVCR